MIWGNRKTAIRLAVRRIATPKCDAKLEHAIAFRQSLVELDAERRLRERLSRVSGVGCGIAPKELS